MFARFASSFLIVGASVGFYFAAGSVAEANAPVGPRYDWTYNGGYFHAVAGGGGAWTESMNGKEVFYFKQSARNDTYVELYDATRNLSVRLYANAMYLKGSGETQYRHFYNGQWDDRRLYMYKAPSQGTPYFNLKTAHIWHWVRSGAQTLYMREILRNNDQIQLYNGAEGVTVSITNGQVWMKKDGFNWFKYADGAWSI